LGGRYAEVQWPPELFQIGTKSLESETKWKYRREYCRWEKGQKEKKSLPAVQHRLGHTVMGGPPDGSCWINRREGSMGRGGRWWNKAGLGVDGWEEGGVSSPCSRRGGRATVRVGQSGRKRSLFIRDRFGQTHTLWKAKKKTEQYRIDRRRRCEKGEINSCAKRYVAARADQRARRASLEGETKLKCRKEYYRKVSPPYSIALAKSHGWSPGCPLLTGLGSG